jgi:hypothetical protein
LLGKELEVYVTPVGMDDRGRVFGRRGMLNIQHCDEQ